MTTTKNNKATTKNESILLAQRHVKSLNNLDSGIQEQNVLLKHLPAFTTYTRTLQDNKHINLTLQYSDTKYLTEQQKQHIFNVTKTNMASLYNQCKDKRTWAWNDNRKYKQLFDDNAKCILLYDKSNNSNDIIGFTHIRYELDDIDQTKPNIYIYEIQLINEYTNMKIGKHIMNILELLMYKLNLYKMVLTVLKHNYNAIKFYKSLNYTVDDSDPSNDDEVVEYEILSKLNKKYKPMNDVT